MQYFLITARKDAFLKPADILRSNAAKLANPTPYSGIRSAPWRNWFYQVAWQPCELVARDLPAPATLAQAAAPELRRRTEELLPFRDAGREFDAISLAYAARAMRELGCVTIADAARAPIDPRYRRLRERILDFLREDRVTSLRAVPDDADQRCDALLARCPEVAGELAMLRRCGPELAAVLSGIRDPLELLFPAGEIEAAERIYDASPFARAVNGLLGNAVASLASPGLRVLEIGGGTGGSTTAVLAHLERCAEYVFTDISHSFLARAREKFERHPFFRARPLDISCEPEAQGFEPGTFDVVIAANVLHATPNLRQTLRNAASLLRPGGLLLLIENTGRLRWGDLTFGLTDGMWNFTDADLRPDYALLTERGWLDVLAAGGFEAPVSLNPGEPDRGGISQQTLLVARRGASAERPACLIVRDQDGVADVLARQMAAAADVHTIGIAEPVPSRKFDEIVHLAALDITGPHDLRPGLESALRLARAAASGVHSPRMTFVVSGAVPAQASLCGFVRTLALEHPELRPRLIELDTTVDRAAAIFRELASADGEMEIAYREGRRLAARLERTSPAAHAPVTVRADRTYLITGGGGGLGIKVAEWLVAKGARHFALAGRGSPAGDAALAIAGMEQRGVRVAVLRADVSREADVVRMLAEIARAMPPLAGVIHSAGVVDDAVLSGQTWDRFETVLAAKVYGAWNLHVHTRDLPLDWFVLFSSAAGLIGSPAQANHAAANAFLDALALARRAQGLPALSIDWGAWGEVGAAARDIVRDEIERRGLIAMPPDQAIAAFEAALSGDSAQVGILDIEWPAFLKKFEAARSRPFFSAFHTRADAAAPVARAARDRELAAELEHAPLAARRDLLLEAIRQTAARILGLPPGELPDAKHPLRDLGLDSLMAVEMRNALASLVKTKLAATLLFDYPSCDALTGFLTDGVLASFFPRSGAAPNTTEEDAGELEELLERELAASAKYLAEGTTA
jgi:NAD(P)-dependent dehydrogenase (short-subunit alcohol dehydrogenase family)/SAM-dependent methyltransferase/acyl carrier protein